MDSATTTTTSSPRPAALVVSDPGAAPERGHNAPISPQESKAKALCPPHGAKQTTGVRPEMEDSYIAIPNFLHVNMQGKRSHQEKWPVRLVDSLPSSPAAASEAETHTDAASAQSAPSPARDFSLMSISAAGAESPRGEQEQDEGEDDLYSETFHFFGVFDGHGGKAAAVHCTKYLHQHFLAALRSMEAKGTDEGGAEDPVEPPPQLNQSLSVIQVYGVETEQAAGGDLSALMSRESGGDEPLPGDGGEGGGGSGKTGLVRFSSEVNEQQQEALQKQEGGTGGAGGSAEDLLMLPRPLERSDTLTPQAIREQRLRDDAKKQLPERTPSESIRMPCGTHVSGVTGQVQGQHSGHYIEGVSTVADLEHALAAAFVQTDAEFNNTGDGQHTGSTAVCCLIGSRHICVANAGDSRAIMLRSDGVVTPLTDDHKPDREDEKDRVEAAGGQILYWNGRRVMGVLAMSRAIGDQGLQPYVIPDPEITVLERRDDDELIIMGSDGIWDVLSNEETCQLAKRALARAHAKGANSRAAAKVAATVLIRAALAKGSRDNITVIVVDLRPHPMDPEMVNNISRPLSGSRSRAASGGVIAAGEPASAAVCSAGSGVLRSPTTQEQPQQEQQQQQQQQQPPS